MRDSSTSSSTISDGSPRRLFVGLPIAPTTSPRWTSTSPVRAAGQSSWMRPLRSTRSRKTSFPMSRRAITRPASRRVSAPSAPGLERVRLGADGGDLVAVGEALRRVVRSRRLDHSPGVRAVLRACRPRARPRSRALRRTGGCLVVRQQHGGQPVARRGVEPGLRAARRRCPGAARPGSTPIPARYQCGPGAPRRAAARRRGRRRGTAPVAAPSRSGVVDERAQRRRRRASAARPGGSQRAAPSTGPAVA